MKFRYLSLLVLLLGAVALIGCGGGGEEATEADGEIVAQVEEWKLTRAELEDMISKLPANQKKKYDSPRGRVELVDLYIEDNLFFEEAKRLGLESDEKVKKALDNALKRILVGEFFKQHVEKRARPSEDEIKDYYELHPDVFTAMPVVKARHFFAKTKAKIDEYKQRMDAGEKMTALVQKYSDDEMTRKDGGDLGYFNPGGYIRFVGYSQPFSDAVFALEPGVISDPIKWEKGWSIVYVVEKEPEKLKTLDEARGEIIKSFKAKRMDLARAEFVEEIKEHFTCRNFLKTELALETRSAEELWNLAQTSTDPRERLIAYEEIVERHPDSDYTAQALFMVGFVFAEELKDDVGADRAFRKVLEFFPGTDVAKSAEWMLKNLNKPLPDFKDLNDLHQQISEEAEESK